MFDLSKARIFSSTHLLRWVDLDGIEKDKRDLLLGESDEEAMDYTPSSIDTTIEPVDQKRIEWTDSEGDEMSLLEEELVEDDVDVS